MNSLTSLRCTSSFVCQVCGSSVIVLLNQKSIFEWYMARLVIKNKY
jgi:hypothetical protein